jgi:thiol-disulfide isomerase/thioredoxin
MNPYITSLSSHYTTLTAALLLCAIALVSPLIHATEDKEIKMKRGDVPPKMLGLTRNGDIVETTQFQGKVLVVTFWATWCAPCRVELGMLERLKRVVDEKKLDLEVVGVNIEERGVFRRAMDVLKDYKIRLVNDPEKRNANAYEVGAIPHMVIIGRDGKVISVHRGYGDSALEGLVAEINQALLTKPAAPTIDPKATN